MASLLRSIPIVSWYRWVASVSILLGGFILLPQRGSCSSHIEEVSEFCVLQFFDSSELNKLDVVTKKFDDLQKTIDSPEQACKFLDSFIQQLNHHYGLALTAQDACDIIRKNISNLQIPLEIQNVILQMIGLLESGNFQIQCGWYWPNEWNWFGLNKKEKTHKDIASPTTQQPESLIEVELPGNCYLGGCELLAGALLCVVPIPGSAWLGGLMIGDGTRRVFDGIVQVSDERRSNPHYVPPSSR